MILAYRKGGRVSHTHDKLWEFWAGAGEDCLNGLLVHGENNYKRYMVNDPATKFTEHPEDAG